MGGKIVYLNDGEMGVITGGGASALTSQRMAQYQRTLRQLEEQHAWKTSGAVHGADQSLRRGGCPG